MECENWKGKVSGGLTAQGQKCGLCPLYKGKQMWGFQQYSDQLMSIFMTSFTIHMTTPKAELLGF